MKSTDGATNHRIFREMLVSKARTAILSALTALGIFGFATVQAIGGPSEIVSPDNVIKISAKGDSLPPQALDRIAGLKNVADVRAYLVVTEGQSRFIGVDLSRPVLVEVDGRLVTPRLVEGRLLKAGDADKDVIVVGKRFAKTNKTGFGYPILGMAAHRPPFFIGDKQVTILGVYETGSAQADGWAMLPLNAVQKLYRKSGKVNLAYVVLDNAATRPSALDEVRKVIGDDATVQPLRE